MIYKIRVILDTKEDVFRDIEVKDNQTLWALHKGIKSAFSLQSEELSSFYESDKNWSQDREIPLEDMSDDRDAETMADVYIKEMLTKIGDRMIYVYDFYDMWTFFVELLEIQDKEATLNYPLTVYRFGKMPLKAPKQKLKGSNDLMISDLDEIGIDDDDILANIEEEEEEEEDFGDKFVDDGEDDD